MEKLPVKPLKLWAERQFIDLHDFGPNDGVSGWETIGELMGVKANTIDRYLRRDLVTTEWADRFCCKVLRCHPYLIYGKEWEV